MRLSVRENFKLGGGDILYREQSVHYKPGKHSHSSIKPLFPSKIKTFKGYKEMTET